MDLGLYMMDLELSIMGFGGFWALSHGFRAFLGLFLRGI